MPSSNGGIDEKGMTILRILYEDSRTPQKVIAGKIGIGAPKLSERLDKLREDGYIKRFTLDMDYEKFGYDVIGFFTISLREKNEEVEKSINEFVLSHPNIIETYELFGDKHDYILKIMCKSNEQLRDVGRQILALDAVDSATSFTHPVAKQIKNERGVAI